MKNKKIFYLLMLGLLTIFSFNMKVDATEKKLTCVYKYTDKKGNTTKLALIKTEDGDLILYKNNKDVGLNDTTSYWEKVEKNIWFIEDKYGTNQNLLGTSQTTLEECPQDVDTSSNTFYKVAKCPDDYEDCKTNAILMESYKFVKLPSTSSSKNEAQELTCVYKKAESSDKVAFTQNKYGVIKLYKNKENVDLNSTNSYWYISSAEMEWKNVDRDDNGNLKECPKSKTTSSWGSGKVTFYGGSNGKNALIEDQSDTTVKNIQTENSNNGNESLDVDSNTYIGKSCEDLKDDNGYLTWLKDRNGYTLRCLYARTIEGYGNSEEKGCHVIQVNLGTSGVAYYDSEASFFKSGLNYSIDGSSINESSTSIINGGECPQNLSVNRSRRHEDTGFFVSTNISFYGSGTPYTRYNMEGNNLVTGAKASMDLAFSLTFNEIKIESCEDLFGSDDEIINMLKIGVNIVKILIPIVLLVLGSLDFAKAVFASNEDEIKKAQAKFIKRLIIAIVIFLIPSMLKVLLNIANKIWPFIDPDLCGII